jgi:hypothetical protein
MTRRLSATGIRNLGFEWPKYALIEECAVTEGGRIYLAQTVERLHSKRAQAVLLLVEYQRHLAATQNVASTYTYWLFRQH